MRKVYLDNLPTKTYKNGIGIDWGNVNGLSFKFQYDEIIGEMKIINAVHNNPIVEVEYNNVPFKINKSSIRKCSFGSADKNLD